MSGSSAVIEHTEVATGLSYAALVERFEQTLNRWRDSKGEALVKSRAAWSEVESSPRSAGRMLTATITPMAAHANGVPEPKQHPGAMPPMGGVTLSNGELTAVASYVWAIGHRSGN